MIYQNKEILECSYLKEQKVKKKATIRKFYWGYCALAHCELHLKISVPFSHKRVDYWSKVYKMFDKSGFKKYPQLFLLVQ